MKVEIILPQMGESVTEGTILKWMKKPGDRVELDEILFEISTDKVDSEIPSPATGIITELKAAEGDTVGIGSVIGYIETEAKQAEVKMPDPKQPVKTEEVKPKPAKSPGEISETTQPVELSPQPEGKPAAPPPPVPEPVHEVETHQTSVAHAVTPAPEQTPFDTKPLMAPGDGERKYYSPLVLKIAQEEGIPLASLETIKGSGIAGRITKKDILANLQRLKLPPESVTDTSPAATEKKGTGGAFDAVPIQTTISSDAIKTRPKIAFAADGTSVVPLDNMRQRIAEHMIHSVRTSVHVTSVSEADVTELVHYRDRENEEFSNREGFALNYAAFVTRALVLAVQDFPNLNASLDGTNIIYKKNINVGIAVALDNGLIVPVVKRAEEKNLVGIARDIFDLSTRARSKKLLPDEVKDSTISITNFGSFGNLFGTPIINQPNIAILGMGVITRKPVVVDEAIAIRDMMYLTLTFDHRVIDGAGGGRFLNKVIEYLENVDALV